MSAAQRVLIYAPIQKWSSPGASSVSPLEADSEIRLYCVRYGIGDDLDLERQQRRREIK